MRLFEKFAAYLRTLGAFQQPTILVAAAGNESRRDLSAKFEIAVSPWDAGGRVVCLAG